MATSHFFQQTFQCVLEQRISDASRRAYGLTHDASVRSIISYTSKIVCRDGKRIRPYLAFLMFRTCGGRYPSEALRLVTALELFHAFALIHDDIMDRGASRHGIPTVHVDVTRRLARQHCHGDLAHVGESQAILAGDLLLTWAHGVLHAPTRIIPERHTMALRIFDAMAEEVIIGQMLDVDLTTRPSASNGLVMEKMRRKTAGYSFIKPLQFGASLAGADQKILRWCETFGMSLGLAFQIQDDLIDLEVPEAQSHKTPFSDLKEQQQTMLTQYIFDHGTATERRTLRTLMGTELKEKDRSRVRSLFEESGAIAYGHSLVDRYILQAERTLDRSMFTRSSYKKFKDFIYTVRDRSH